MLRFSSYTLLLAVLLLGTSGLLGTACLDATSSPEMRHFTPPPDTLRTTLLLDSLFAAYAGYDFRPPATTQEERTAWVEATLARLTRDQKIGQLLIAELPARNGRVVKRADARAVVEQHQVGGFIVRRLLPPREVYAATEALQEVTDVPLFFAADYERGAGRFTNNLTELPSNMALGATRSTDLAAAAGRLTAIESRALGVNLLFAPVVDVNNNPFNPIINIRSYGENPSLVAEMAAAFVREAETYGVLTTLKHFPGHGNTTVDSHARMGHIPGERRDLERIELYPYAHILQQSSPPAGVMTAHLWADAYDAEPLPATFSETLLQGVLRDEMGFEGFVVTDDVKMGALNQTYSFEARVLRPLLAGADVILTPDDLGRAIRVIRKALADGRYTEARLDASVRRVLHAKAKAGLHLNRYAHPEHLSFLLAAPRGEHVARHIAHRAVTLLKPGKALPLQADRTVALVQLTNYSNSESIEAAKDSLAAALPQPLAADIREDTELRVRTIDEHVAQVAGADVIVLALYLRLRSGRGDAGLRPAQERLVEALLARPEPVVLITFGNPYAVSTFPEAAGYIVAYDQSLATIESVSTLLYAQPRQGGQLPVTAEPYQYGTGY